MAPDGTERRKEDIHMDAMRTQLNNVLIQMGKIENQLTNISAHNTEFRDQINKEVARLSYIVNGNGRPENGMVYKTERNTEFRIFWEKFGWLILSAFTTIPCAIISAVVIHIVGPK